MGEDGPRLRDLVAAGGMFVLTGAGMSTDSGIPDYRGPDGVQKAHPMQESEFLRSREARRRYWARSFIGWPQFCQAQPNDGHRAVAELQRRGLVHTLVTQNVDGLHQQAGAVDVEELHGGLDVVDCLACGTELTRAALQDLMAADNPDYLRAVTAGGGVEVRPDGDVVLADRDLSRFVPPTCPACGADVLKPRVVFFGGSVPRDQVARCFAAVEAARSVLVLGSSLAVMSGLRFVRRAAALGRPVAIVTRGWCRGDEHATLRLDADLTPVLTNLVWDLDRRPSPP